MLALPLGPSNAYSFSTASHGIRRRSAASASRARVNSFSLTSSCWRAASHSCGDTIGGVFMADSYRVVIARGLPWLGCWLLMVLVIDTDVEGSDALRSCLRLRRVGHVQGQGRDAAIGVGQGLAR